MYLFIYLLSIHLNIYIISALKFIVEPVDLKFI